jgi:hypothetical protein
VKSVADELAELRTLDVDALVARYEQVFGRAPRSRNHAHLLRKIGWRIQELRFGGLSTVARRRLDELASQVELPVGLPVREIPRKSGALAIGTVLVRDWRGQRVEVRVLDNGFEWNNVVHRSLSAVAQAITGAHWSGALFFGLRQRSRA